MKLIYSLLCLSFLYFVNGINAMAGQASYYDDQGSGSCGTFINAKTELLVAVPSSYWTTANPNSDPVCKSNVRVTYNGKTITLPVRDKCPKCGPTKIDISELAFIQLAGGTDKGILDITWEFVEGGMGGSSSSGSSSSSSSGTVGCSKTATVDAGQGCWDVWTSKCGNQWSETQFFASNPGVSCSALKIGQQLCCGGSMSGSGSNSGSGTPSSSGGSSGTVGCTKTATVDAGQGCWDVWTSKCGNSWSETQFFASNPGVSCSALKIGQQLCCGGSPSGSSSGSVTSASPSSGGSSGTVGCSKTATVDASQGCWDVWTSKCGNQWSETQFFASNPGVSCSALKIGQQLCCGGSMSNSGSSSIAGTSPASSSSSGTCSKKGRVDAGQGCWDVWTSKCGNTWDETQFYRLNPGIGCTSLKIGQELCCN